MLSKEGIDEVLKKCADIDEVIYKNINLIPINNWKFDEEIIEQLRDQKHNFVNKHLTRSRSFSLRLKLSPYVIQEQQKKLSNASKQRLAREIGAGCQTVTDVLEWMAKNCSNIRPIKPEKKVTDSKDTKAINFQNGGTSISNTDCMDTCVEVVSKSAKKRKKNHSCTSFDGKNSESVTATSVVPVDAVEGRKLALKKLQEKLKKFKGNLSNIFVAQRIGKMTAFEYEEKRKLKRRMSKLKMKQRRTAAKQEANSHKLSQDEPQPSKRAKIENRFEITEKNNEKMIFSKFDFIVRDAKKTETKRDKRDKFAGKDYKRLLEKAEKREERLEQMRLKNPEKASKVEKNIQWKKALNRAEGQKVKDNPELLKHSLKKKEMIKQWRKKKWAKRIEHMEQVQSRKQEKRSTNIQARKDIVRKRKLQKARNKGRILTVMGPAFTCLLLITIQGVICYETEIPDLKILRDAKLSRDPRSFLRAKRTTDAFRGYAFTHFYGVQTKINNQFAEFQIQAATFAANVQRDRNYYFFIAKIFRLFRTRSVVLHFIFHTLGVIMPSVLGLVMAVFVWRSLVEQIDGSMKPPLDGVKLPPLRNKPPGFYVPIHRRPLIYLQLLKEKCYGKKGKYVSLAQNLHFC
ncbi:unnamed protein product [Thelazia callipaeda]|uniref:SURF6 domain-containing protein n=1 Tax=Thelazia callipaeda TaxID=103827 RepID=A0A0N5CZ77_THECL|nr:unnamed protein product [Thelazia callipaeda]